MKSKRTAYYHDRQLEQNYLLKSARKIEAFKAVLNVVSEFLSDINNTELAKSPTAYVRHAIQEKYKHTLPVFDYVRLCELIGLDLAKLEKAAKVFNGIGGVDVDYKNLKPKQKDFHLYVEGEEEHERLKVAEYAMDAFRELNKHRRIMSGDFARATNGILMVDISNPTQCRINPTFLNNNLHSI